MDAQPRSPGESSTDSAALASDDRDALCIRVVNLNASAVTASVEVDGGLAGAAAWAGTMTVLSGKPDDHNSPEKPRNIVPTETRVTAGQLTAGLEFSGHSFTVLNLTRAGGRGPAASHQEG